MTRTRNSNVIAAVALFAALLAANLLVDSLIVEPWVPGATATEQVVR